ncbi:MAG: UxaA family hydrolase [Rhodospirillales bacterium]|nr:UxaA family hydrolase [Rhodospirillales bacterium]MDH3792154.1 UxaA family hydrolase [Rhodospirillales bacterium]MDH3911237.1 UxaA family hydrolase [Rhodospirillales bacterium]MDH3917438.1 UxaA family hydrolase [Rhodospirillales bacterium]MDH3966179.1 UxaA family hydrolase [Rhodospirillales bacterium]
MSAPDYLVHGSEDTVGVVVVESVKANAVLTGLDMSTGQTLHMDALADIPLGHKIALKDLAVGDTVVKYGHDIGKVVAAAKAGDHVHVHNIKTKRW